MKRITSLSRITQAERGAYTAIGNFDGVHLGHQAVLELTKKSADAQGAPLAVLTFEPHPREVFRPDDPPFRLMNSEAKAHRLSKLGVDLLYEIPFDAALFGLAEAEFSEKILVNGLGVSGVTVGADFCYGKGRAGNTETLRQAGQKHGFAVTIAELLGLAGGGERVSSTAIRNALHDGVPHKAAAMLGHWHRIEGPVLHGEKRGRNLGYPTANMDISGIHPPKFGVYAVLVEVVTGPHAGHYRGVSSLGIRPMFGENLPNLETHLFDFKGELYDEHLSVGLVQFLRPEMKFDGVDALVAQIRRDEDKAREILSQVPLVGFPREAIGSFQIDV
ncbi:bifunctional riboflavin kinase/FAD synthetase [Aliiruegeria lutimaris]|uniref:Riboflavin biosynthesis protein n=1 Tax=Aliiruegeria lutimaris TaxID=571298 RepID=A0A1G9C5Z7_9RHOB|nr:bifunctional riboflavin kinase/FAD synthetase [Aliiruegeria lutimaris]SDK46765.1 riboflavin kinase / FMN adenylyltransferase [Aliiruegeria lutimaris]